MIVDPTAVRREHEPSEALWSMARASPADLKAAFQAETKVTATTAAVCPAQIRRITGRRCWEKMSLTPTSFSLS